jgi:hypothetical protein
MVFWGSTTKKDERGPEHHAAAQSFQSLWRGHSSRKVYKIVGVNEFGFTSPTACFCIPQTNMVRKYAQKLVSHVVFRYLILLAIIINCVMMAAADFSEKCMAADYELISTDECPRNKMLLISEPFFLALFLLELTSKFIAMGIYECPTVAQIRKKGWTQAWGEASKSGFFNSGWNILDFLIVFSSSMDVVCPNCKEMGLNFSFLRVIRALRPLRTLQSIPALRYLIEMLLCSVLSVSYTLVFLMFVFVVWAIMAVQMWGWDGRTHGRCRLTEFPVTLGDFAWPIDDVAIANAYYSNSSNVTRCVDWDNNERWSTPQPCIWPIVQGPIQRLCGLDPAAMPDGAVVVEGGARMCPMRSGFRSWCGSNFDVYGNSRFDDLQVMRADLFTRDTNWGFNNYNNIFTTSVTVFQGLTMGGWRRIVWQISDCFNPVVGPLYWASLMIIGNYFLVKLILAVMVRTYNQQDASNNLEDQRAQANAVFAMMEEYIGGDEGGFISMGQLRKSEKQLAELRNKGAGRIEIGSMVKAGIETGVKAGVEASATASKVGNTKAQTAAKTKAAKAAKMSRRKMYRKYGVPAPIYQKLKRVIQAGSGVHKSYPVGKELFRELMFTTVNKEMAAALEEAALEAEKEAMAASGEVAAEKLDETEEEEKESVLSKVTNQMTNVLDDTLSQLITRGVLPLWQRPLLPFLQPYIQRHYFEHTMLGLILMNTIIMCCDRYPLSSTEEEVWVGFGHFFNAAFSIEMVVKLLALGVTQYGKDMFNLLDAFLVLATWTEWLVMTVGNGQDGTGAFMALRTLRLMRLFKVLWKFPGLQCESYMVVRMINQISAFALLFVVFLIVMGLIGRQQLAHRLRFSTVDGYPVGLDANTTLYPYDVPRTNFDSLANSMLACMQLVTGERWEQIMFDASRAVGSSQDFGSHMSGNDGAAGGVAICVITVIIGQFIVLNIFVAMLINSQQTLTGAMLSADMVLDKVEVTVYHDKKAQTVSLSRGKLDQISKRGEPCVWLILAELVDVAVQDNGIDDVFGLDRDDLAPDRMRAFKLFLLPDLSREVVPRQLKDIGNHFGRGEKVRNSSSSFTLPQQLLLLRITATAPPPLHYRNSSSSFTLPQQLLLLHITATAPLPSHYHLIFSTRTNLHFMPPQLSQTPKAANSSCKKYYISELSFSLSFTPASNTAAFC